MTHHVSSVHVCTVKEKKLTNVGMTFLCCNMQRRFLHLCPGVPAAAGPQQDLAGLESVVLGGEVEGRGAQPVCGEGRPPGHEQPHLLRVPVLGGGEQLLAELHQGRVIDGVPMLAGDSFSAQARNLDLLTTKGKI